MGNRISKVYTRTGDSGSTGLANGDRVAKDDHRIEAIGDVDELNSSIGVALCHDIPKQINHTLTRVQHDLFDLGGELSLPGHAIVQQSHYHRLEDAIDDLNSGLAPLKEFILPGGHSSASAIHLARTICRRAERHTVALMDSINPHSLIYLNRLSDYLFVAARYSNQQHGFGDILWLSEKNRGNNNP